jgi:hypothetical protein
LKEIPSRRQPGKAVGAVGFREERTKALEAVNETIRFFLFFLRAISEDDDDRSSGKWLSGLTGYLSSHSSGKNDFFTLLDEFIRAKGLVLGAGRSARAGLLRGEFAAEKNQQEQNEECPHRFLPSV